MHFGTEQNVGPKPPTVRFEMEAVLAGARSTWSFVPTRRISSYSYSAKRYSVKRYSYSMAVRNAAIALVEDQCEGSQFGVTTSTELILFIEDLRLMA